MKKIKGIKILQTLTAMLEEVDQAKAAYDRACIYDEILSDKSTARKKTAALAKWDEVSRLTRKFCEEKTLLN